ncbi:MULTISPECIES: glycosyltransferase [Glaesserella]|uniref:Amylovoran biosynthesis protein AmsE n=1 Tax=Glaesserella australis TaxID=2094024 RepID=A0A328C092_9PAST|nr:MULTISPECIES: glycosyltransferase [Glaesserella]AUI65268.1 amylovoran biosynthesis protein AmsE [Glaesserella sp. 15-184]RAL18540.1 amylovoran biosynthesis protein AmsE [Glaesserella australis]
MKFSVLMSLYFKEKPEYLIECFESLKNQTVQADEIVVVFDGAITPELEQVVQNFAEILSLNIVRLKQNQGLGKALNHGLTHCRNEWVFRMDTDDICVPERFEKQVAFIEQNPDTIIFGGQIAEFGQHINDIVSYRRVPTETNDIVAFTQKRCPFNHMTVAYQKSAVLESGGYQDLQEDYYLWIKLVALGKKVANLPDILVYARVGNGMVGRRRGIAQAKAEWRLFKLKYKVGIQGYIPGFIVFLMRSIPRLLPTSLLSHFYKLLRK